MRFVLAALCACVVGPAIAQAANTASKELVGTWKYDVSTMHLELNEKGKAALKNAKNPVDAKKSLAKYESQLGDFLKQMTLVFKADRSVKISIAKPQSQSSGTWTLVGREVKVVMTDAKQKTPHMDLAANGKRIHTIYSEPNFGIGKIDLVKS